MPSNPLPKKVKFKHETTKKKGGWSEWILPVMNGYHMKCCDCGLVHTINFVAVEVEKANKTGGGIFIHQPKNKYRVMFKLRRNDKLSANKKKK